MVENSENSQKSQYFPDQTGVWHTIVGYPHPLNELQNGIFLAPGPNVNHYCASKLRGVGKFCGMGPNVNHLVSAWIV